MERTLTQSLSLLRRNFLSLQTFCSSAVSNNLSFFPPRASNFILLKKFSSSISPTNQKEDSQAQQEEDDDVSNDELKKRIGKFYEGDDDAIPSIFEAILKRKLAGKHDESDNELLEEFGRESPDDNDFDSE